MQILESCTHVISGTKVICQNYMTLQTNLTHIQLCLYNNIPDLSI